MEQADRQWCGIGSGGEAVELRMVSDDNGGDAVMTSDRLQLDCWEGKAVGYN